MNVECINNFVNGKDDREYNWNNQPTTFRQLDVGSTYEVVEENEIQYKIKCITGENRFPKDKFTLV